MQVVLAKLLFQLSLQVRERQSCHFPTRHGQLQPRMGHPLPQGGSLPLQPLGVDL